jgi:ApaG protein
MTGSGPGTRSEAVTHGVRVAVESHYAAAQSRPAAGYWLFHYNVRITNEGTRPVQLVSRHWIITDAEGDVQEVKGPGVVGHQPLLEPGESFSYTSGCPLSTPYGTMEGSYRMVAAGGEEFDARVAPFLLTEPYAVH